MSDSANPSPVPARTPSIDAETFSHLIEAEARRFKDWLERLTINGVGDKAAAAELAAITARHDGLVNIQRGYLS